MPSLNPAPEKGSGPANRFPKREAELNRPTFHSSPQEEGLQSTGIGQRVKTPMNSF